jgi:CubicO group peptidase (beta-lactamase class C family)
MIRSSHTWWALVQLCLFAGGAWGDALPQSKPEEVGFSSKRLNYIDAFYAEEVKKGELAGIVTLVSRRGKIVHFSAVGYADIETRRKMKLNSIFRLYSMTKPIAATALMLLYQEGRFQLDDPLSKYMPEFNGLRVLRTPDSNADDTVPPLRAPTIHDVLRHTAGFTHCVGSDSIGAQCAKEDVFGIDVTLAEMANKLARIPLHHQPGTTYEYSIGPDIEARLVEVLSGMSFDDFLERRLFKPLRMSDTAYLVPPEKRTRLVTPYLVKDGKLTSWSEDDPKSAWSVNSCTVAHKRTGGSFGLTSTTADYWRFAQMLLNNGQLAGVRILDPQVVQFMTRDHLGLIEFHDDQLSRSAEQAFGFGLGFAVVKDPAAAGFMGSEGTYFWQGAIGTLFWVDPTEDLVVVAMIQEGSAELGAFWAQVRTLIYSALLE